MLKIQQLLTKEQTSSGGEPFENDRDVSKTSYLVVFREFTEQDVLKLIQNSKKTSCLLDPAPTKFIMTFKDTLAPVIFEDSQLEFI